VIKRPGHYPHPTFPQGGRLALQSGSVAKIGHRAIFKRSALPWGKVKGGENTVIENSGR